jgi:hypothetical protein
MTLLKLAKQGQFHSTATGNDLEKVMFSHTGSKDTALEFLCF